MLYKVPLPTLLLWLLGLGSIFQSIFRSTVQHNRGSSPSADRGMAKGEARADEMALLAGEWVLLCPLLFFTVYFNFFYRAQIGLRFFLVVFPLLCVLSGRLVRHWTAVPRAARLALAGAGLYLAASVGSYFPHYLAYFNELVGNRRLAYRLLADSNLDWGQHLWYQERYMAAHPGAIIEPDRPTAGTIIVGTNSLTGVAGDPERFRWLRDHFTPVDDIAYSTLVYRVTQADLDRLGLGQAPAR
jgi:hypothetical protein